MRKVIASILSFFLFLFAISSVFADRAEAGGGQQACSIAIAKEATVAGILFEFLVEPSVGDDLMINTVSGSSTGFNLNFGQSAVVSEIVPEGWRLVDVTCESGPGIAIIIDEENNVLINCLTVSEGVCTFTNVPAENIPTLSEWGMIAAAGGLMIVGVWFAVRRRRGRAV
ncbi:MAG: hypothetical protein AB1598_06085 [Thermodesulfobacteriota bacterium]